MKGKEAAGYPPNTRSSVLESNFVLNVLKYMKNVVTERTHIYRYWVYLGYVKNILEA
jgi:hypothetical protein